MRSFVLINYAIEDDVELQHSDCPCGRQHPLLKTVKGRSGESILLPNGFRINSHVPQYIFKSLAELRVIQRYRFVLRGDNLKLYLVVSDNFSESHLNLVKQETRCALGDDIKFDVEIVSQLENLPNAKHKSFVVFTNG